eukprot:4536392-Pyramimonas_sp.AAC.1
MMHCSYRTAATQEILWGTLLRVGGAVKVYPLKNGLQRQAPSHHYWAGWSAAKAFATSSTSRKKRKNSLEKRK